MLNTVDGIELHFVERALRDEMLRFMSPVLIKKKGRSKAAPKA